MPYSITSIVKTVCWNLQLMDIISLGVVWKQEDSFEMDKARMQTTPG